MNQLNIAEKDYIYKNLVDFAPYFEAELRSSVKEKGLISPSKGKDSESQHLKDNIKCVVAEKNGWPVINVHFADYGRLIEISSRRKKMRLYNKMSVTRSLFGNISKVKKGKNQMWYTRRSWGVVYHVLVPNVMYDLMGVVAEALTKTQA